MDEFRNLTAEGILHHIIHSQKFNIDTYTFIIAGKSGPTGKSWLTNELNTRGYTAVELSESIGPIVQYRDDDNHVIVNGRYQCVLIVLNRRLPMYKNWGM